MKQTKTPYVIGKKYVFRTVTMIYTGKLEAVYDHELVISSAAWIAETERWATSLNTGVFKEVEPYPKVNIIITRDAVLDATPVTWVLPTQPK